MNSQIYVEGERSQPSRLPADELVRRFVVSVLNVRSKFHAGIGNARDPLATIEAEARRMGDIVLGRDALYGPQPWQNVSLLGAQLKVLLPNETKHYGDPGCALFMWLANQALKASAALDEGSTEESVKANLRAVVEDVVSRVTGAR